MGDHRMRSRTAAVAVLLVGVLAGAAVGSDGHGSDSPAGAEARGRAPRFELARIALDAGGLPAVGFLSGVSIDPTWAVGVGVEYERFDEASAVPLFLHLRVTPKGGAIGHLVFVEAGYSLVWLDGTPGTDGSGPFARGGMGRRVGWFFGTEVHASVSYRIQVSDAYARRTGEEGSVLTEFALGIEFGL